MSGIQSKSDHDLIIVGAGLAGSILAWKLTEHGKKMLVINDPATPSASRAAAGLINPVTGQRLVLQNNIEELLAAAHQFYHELEGKFDIKLLHEKRMLRLFRSERERSSWEKRRSEESYRPFIDSELCQPDGFYQFHTGFLDTNLLLDSLHEWLQQHNALCEERFDYNELSRQQIIFCEGWRAQNNPWFDWLPFQPAKGEILTFRSTSALPDRIINRGKWLLPTDAHTFKLGATYDWKTLNESITDSARDEITDHLPQLCDDPGEIQLTDHVAGVRPGTRDKQPFIGHHPDHPHLGIFNGFGSKGSLLIPWYADRFVDHLTNHTPLPPEADIQRFRKASHG